MKAALLLSGVMLIASTTNRSIPCSTSVRDDSVFIEGDAYPSTVVNSGQADSWPQRWPVIIAAQA